MTKSEALLLSAYTGVLLAPFNDFHAYCEKLLERPVYTHEMGTEQLSREIKAKVAPTLESMLLLLWAER